MEAAAGLHHSSVFFDSENELCRSMAASAEEGLASGEAVYLTVHEPSRRTITSLMGEVAEDVHFTDAAERYTSPVTAMHQLVTVVNDLLRSGATRIRSLGEVRPGNDEYSEWVRYEAAIEEVFAGYPLTGVCFYDSRLVSDPLRRRIERTHRHRGATAPWDINDDLLEPSAALSDFPPRRLHPARRPDLTFSPVSQLRPVRLAAAELAPEGRFDDCALVVHELTALASAGDASAQVRMWSQPDLLAVQVLSSAQGRFDDVFAGLRPAKRGDPMAALWLAGQLADDLSVAPLDGYSAITVVFGQRS